MKDKYILDSSIWIEIERKNPKILALTAPWIQNNEICLIDVIQAEILRGVKSQKDFRILRKAFSDFPQLSTEWGRVSELAFEVSRKGFHPPLIDLYIAQCVHENNRILVTQDKHFPQIAKVRPFKFFLLKS